MARVYLSLGSNISPHTYISASLDELATCFGDLTISSVYESEAVGFEGDNFLNLVVGVDTELSVGELSKTLKNIEDKHGRERSGPKFSGRTLDIDILTYGDRRGTIDGVVIPRDEVVKNAFVLLPLSEIAPTECHPVFGTTYQELWAQYCVPQKLWKIDFIWRKRRVSHAH